MPIHPVYRTSQGLTEQGRTMLARQGNAILATINDDGTPHLTELLFLLDESDRVLLPTPHNTRKVRNVTKRPVATVFFFDQPGWISCVGDTTLLTGAEADRANQANRDRLLTPAGHATIGRVLAAHEDTTIVVTPTRWLGWSSDQLRHHVEEMGGDLAAHPPETWFRDLG
jgi:hypothetical protein